MERNKEFTQDLVDFISEHEDFELAGRIFDAICKETINEEGKGDTKKTFVAIAKATAMFLSMCSDMTPDDEKVSTEDFMESYTDVLDLYCFSADADRRMEKEDNANTDEENN